MRRIEDVLRPSESPDDLVLLLRGGSDTRAKLVRHAERLEQRFSYQGKSARGISLFAARGDLDARIVLTSRLSTYRKYHRTSGSALASLALLLPTFDAPHWTLLFRSPAAGRPRPEAELLDHLLDILGPALDNPKYVPPEARRR